MKRHSGKKHISLLLSFIMIFTTCFLPSSSFAYATEDLSIENLDFSMETSEKCNLGKFKTDLKLESSADEGTGETVYNLIVPDYDIFYSVPGGTAGKENDRLTTFRIALPDKSNYKLILNFNEVFAGNTIGHSLESDENGVISTDKFLYGQSYDKSFSIEIIPPNENKGKIYTVNVIPEISINTFSVMDAKNIRRPLESSKTVGALLKPSESEFTTDALAGTKVKVQPSTHSDMLVGKDKKPTYNFTVNGKAEELKRINNTYAYEFTVPEANTDTVLTFQPKADGYVSHDPIKLTIKSSSEDFFPDLKPAFGINKWKVGDTGKKLTCLMKNKNTEGYTYDWYSGPKVNAMTYLTTTEGPDLPIDTSVPGKTFYKCEVSKTVDGRIYKASKNQKIVQIEPVTGNETIAAPVIQKQSGEIKTVVGASVDNLFVEAEGSRSGKLTFKWYVNDKNSREGATEIANATSQSYKPETKQEGVKYYFCEIRDTISVTTYNLISEPVYSNIMKVTVDKDKAFTLEGEGTKEAPYLIKNASDLSQLAAFVNEKHFAYSDTHFALTSDITLPKEWTPIGSTKDGSTDAEYGMNIAPFSGIFDGEYNGKIHTVTVPENGLPLFGYVRNAEIRNLNIYGKKIAGYGLINNYDIDYGEDGNYQTGVPKIATIDNVTIKKGTKTLRAGFVGGFGSGENTVEIRNCTAEENVIIGYSHERGSIGSFAGSLNGTMINCKSAADVYGTSNVGGLAGNKGQSMGPCSITNCEFTGNVVATGRHVGGIIGSGYDGGGTAPNTPVVSIKNCLVTGNITGADRVGGILGAEPGCEDCWANGAGSILDSLFTGKINATKSDSDVGAIIGFLKSINEHQKVGDNYFKENCGAKYGVGRVELIKTDDFDITKTAVEVTDKQLKNGTVKDLLNKSATSLKNWKQGTNNPIHSKEPVAYKLNLSGEYKTDYIVNEEFDNSGIVVTADYSDGSNRPVELQNLTFVGFDSSKAGYKDIKVKFGAAEASYRICVTYANPEEIQVTFMLLGDEAHNSDKDKNVHCLSKNNLTEWIPKKTFNVTQNNTVKDVIELALKENNATCKNPSGNYVESITYKDKTLGEFTNGAKSGWMYTLNGNYPSLGISEQFLSDGDEIIFHYTDDYTKEIGLDELNQTEAEKVDNLISALGKVTLEKENQIKEARDAYKNLSPAAQKLVTKLNVLKDAETKLEELKAADAKTAEDAKVVDNLIGAIGKVTLDSEKTIKEARDAYNALSEAAQKKVTNLENLKVAETELAKLKEAAALEKAKDDAKAEVNGMAALSAKQKADYVAMIDKAESENDVQAVVDAAKKLNDADKADANKADGNKSEAGSKTPKTGDTDTMMPWIVLLLGAVGTVAVIKRKKEQ